MVETLLNCHPGEYPPSLHLEPHQWQLPAVVPSIEGLIVRVQDDVVGRHWYPREAVLQPPSLPPGYVVLAADLQDVALVMKFQAD